MGYLESSAPFVRPIPFSSEHADIFFGREACLARRFDRLVNAHSPLLVINGLSGAGKTSLLRAGLIPLLEKRGYSVAYTRILSNPVADVVQGVLGQSPATEGRLDADMGVLQAINQIVGPAGHSFVLIVDQLERCFALAGGNRAAQFWTDIARLVGGDARCPVKVIVAVRADWLYFLQNVSPDPWAYPCLNFCSLLNPLNLDEAEEKGRVTKRTSRALSYRLLKLR